MKIGGNAKKETQNYGYEAKAPLFIGKVNFCFVSTTVTCTKTIENTLVSAFRLTVMLIC